MAFHLLTKVGDILTEYDEVFSLKRNEKIGTGFPNNRKENDNEKRKITKMELVKSRFKSHLIGKKSTDAVFDKVKKHAEENQPNTNQELYEKFLKNNLEELVHNVNERHNICLLYTSDAADE